ncbi:putative DNA repair protein RadC [Pillotina sp. SPG140]|jgi:DNA repair protein RadC
MYKDTNNTVSTNNLCEKLKTKGVSFLSDRELLAVALSSAGTKGKHVNHAAHELLKYVDTIETVPTVQTLSQINGIDETQVYALVALLELGRRRWDKAKIHVVHPKDIYSLLYHYADRRQEHFIALSLNGAHEVLAVRTVTIGLVNKTIVHPREVFADPILDRASAVVVAHNHPSGYLNPSPEDDEITERLKASADILGINFLDHVIFSEQGYFSYRQAKRL